MNLSKMRSMQVIKNLQMQQDAWQLLRDVPDPLPAGDLIFPFAYWSEHRSELAARSPLGVCVSGDNALEELIPELDAIDLIALDFPQFTDGRCYSHARMLREHHGYRGELRAVGEVLQDQLFFMQRCGIDSFHLRPDQDPQKALRAFQEISVKYQAAADGAPPLSRYR